LHELRRTTLFTEKELLLIIQIMKKCIVFLFLAICVAASSRAQSPANGQDHLLSLNASLPLGRFSESHAAGIGLSYHWSNRRFGDNITDRKLIGFTAQAGFDYLFGKNDTLLGHTFKNRNIIYVQIMPGIMCNPSPKTAITLSAGPSLGIYNGVSNIAVVASLSGSYHIGRKVSIGPSLVLRKHEEVDMYWTAGLSGRFLLH
jgi:hypothetical protein